MDRIATLTIGHAIPTGGQWTADEVRTCILDCLADHGIDGATLTDATGVWQGDLEPSTACAIWCTASDMPRIMGAGQMIRAALEQDAVGLTVTAADIAMIGKP